MHEAIGPFLEGLKYSYEDLVKLAGQYQSFKDQMTSRFGPHWLAEARTFLDQKLSQPPKVVAESRAAPAPEPPKQSPAFSFLGVREALGLNEETDLYEHLRGSPPARQLVEQKFGPTAFRAIRDETLHAMVEQLSRSRSLEAPGVPEKLSAWFGEDWRQRHEQISKRLEWLHLSPGGSR
jgi:hypothetical protein